MNKKVFITMISLSVAFLVLCYFLKFFFPQEFVMAVENKQIILIAQFIDNTPILYYLFAALTAFITYWLYCCACSHRLFLKWYECLIIVGVIAIVRVVGFVDINVSTAISICSFVFLPYIMGGNLKNTAIIYSIHLINQSLTLTIRDVVLYMQYMSTLTTTILAIDVYIWLTIFYALFNYSSKKEN